MSRGFKDCEVEGCDQVRGYKRFCQRHWYRWKRYGDPHLDKATIMATPLRGNLKRPKLTYQEEKNLLSLFL